ncbi:MAG: hypothetical protein GY868_18295, partial [Deltaproteobacteria bacterium]|nr:hypothetical protein [Deltaproteobacteria bacterium]
MSDEYSFPPFEKVMMKALDKFGGQKMETYKGMDVKQLWDLKGGGLTSSFKYLYSAPKLEKIVITAQAYRDKLMSYAVNIFADEKHALPIYCMFWAESAKGSYFILDLFAGTDLITDIAYMEQYMSPLENTYDRAIKHYHEIPTRDPDWFRALVSPYYINADFAPSTKESQDLLLGFAADYLEIYYQLWEKDEPRDTEYMQRINERREAIR